jgi:Domain of unknown function (DUF4082)
MNTTRYVTEPPRYMAQRLVQFLSFCAAAMVSTALFAQTTGATYSFWSDATTPDPDTTPVELGVKFRSSEAGTISKIRFYRAVAIGSGYRASLWKADGTLLRQAVVIEGQSPTPGWQTVIFSPPVNIEANQTYIASYFSSIGQYPSDEGFFADRGLTSGPLRVLRDDEEGGNGVYLYGPSGGFPVDTWRASNYWVDVAFVSSTPASTAIGTTVFAANAVPAQTLVQNNQSVELGMRFCPKTDGVVRGIRYYRGNGSTGTNTGTIWSVDNNSSLQSLGSVSFPASSASGWVQADFAVATYVVSYFNSAGFYSVTENYFAGRNIDTPLLRAFADTAATPNGVFRYGSGGVGPTSTYRSSNYWVDLDFVRELPLGIFNPCEGVSPGTAIAEDSSSVELGVTFIPKVSGTINGVRFLHNVGFGSGAGSQTNVLSYPVSVWSADGTQLATGSASVSQNPTTGWLSSSSMSQRVKVVAGQRYIVSYRAPAGRYPITLGGLSSGYEGDLFSVPINGGVFTYGPTGEFPSQSVGSNYFVDLRFVPDE